MIHFLGWLAFGLAAASLVGLIGLRRRSTKAASPMLMAGILAVVATLLNATPGLLGAAAPLQVIASVTSIVVSAAAVIVLYRRRYSS